MRFKLCFASLLLAFLSGCITSRKAVYPTESTYQVNRVYLTKTPLVYDDGSLYPLGRHFPGVPNSWSDYLANKQNYDQWGQMVLAGSKIRIVKVTFRNNPHAFVNPAIHVTGQFLDGELAGRKAWLGFISLRRGGNFSITDVNPDVMELTNE